MNNNLKIIEAQIDDFLNDRKNQLQNFSKHIFNEISSMLLDINLKSITITFEERELFLVVPKFDFEKIESDIEINEEELSMFFEKISFVLYKMNFKENDVIVLRKDEVLIS